MRWLALFLAGCASLPAGPRLHVEGAWRLEGDWQTDGARWLRVRSAPVANAEEAHRELDALRGDLNRKLDAQVDPYYGTRRKNPYCTGEKDGLFFLAADKDKLLDCYAASPRYQAVVQHLACNGAVYTIELLYEKGEPPSRLATCE